MRDHDYERMLKLPVWLRMELIYLAWMQPDRATMWHNIAVSGERILDHIETEEIGRNG